jgi:hypothetical protein
MRCTDRKLTPAAFASIRPVQWVASPGGGDSAKSTTRWAVVTGSGGLPGLRVLSRVRLATPSRHETRLPPPYHRLGLADRRMISAVPAAVGGGKNDFGAANMLLRRVAIADNRLKPTTISRHDVDDNSCSHDGSSNCFG